MSLYRLHDRVTADARRGVVFLPLLLAAAWLLAPPLATAQQTPAAHGYGGGIRVRAPVDDPTLRISSSLAWGRYSSQGSHDRLSGRLALVGWATRWLSLGGRVDGTLDLHPGDELGSDRSYQAEPALLLGASYRPPWGGAGLLLDVRFPGAAAPSLQLAATTVEARAWAAWRTGTADSGALQLMGNVGYRLDRTSETLAEPNGLRPGDRRALQISELDAFLLSVAVSYRKAFWEPLVEVSFEPWVGSPSPGVDRAPLRIAAALRAHLEPLSLLVGAEVRATSNAPVDDTLLVPLEPRWRVFLAASFGWSRAAPTAPAEEPETIPEVVDATRYVEGVVTDHQGAPMPAALVQLRRQEDALHEATADSAGAFRLPLPPGDAGDVRVAVLDAEGSVLVDQPVGAGAPLQLRAPAPASTGPSGALRGLVRDFSGAPLSARISVGEMQTQTDEEGRFELELSPGSHEVTLEADGFQPQTRTVRVDDNGVTVLNVELRPSRR